jgi:NosR/NirI family nitrous oxide reductase transcriptional regulator
MARTTKHLIFFSGLFSLCVQILLFREYLPAFGGHDMCAGLFLAMSFSWMAVGIAVADKAHRFISADLSVLLCIPASCLQYGLILLAGRALAAQAAVIPPIHQMLAWSLVTTAPLSLLMGILVSVLGLHVRRNRWPVPLAHAVVAAGGLVGGLITTFLLGKGLPDTSVFLGLVAILCGSVVWSTFGEPRQQQSRARQVIAISCLGTVAAALAVRADEVLTAALHEVKWHGAELSGEPDGSFTTAQGQYLYGEQDGQWIVVRNGRVSERIGDSKGAGRVAAMVLAQNSRAQRIVVIGGSLSLCQAFLVSPQITSVDWFNLDPQYIPALMTHLPGQLGIQDQRLHVQTGDIRQSLSGKSEAYDIMVVDLPSGINAALHPYVSMEFLARTAKTLTPMGLLALGIPNKDHATTAETGYIGAWLKTTLDSVFTQTIVVPHDRLFFLAAKLPFLLTSPTSLAVRFSLLENAPQILPPEEVESIYEPDRIKKVLDSYGSVGLPSETLLNSDLTPSYPWCHLLLTAERSHLTLLKPVRSFLQGGPILAVVAAVLLGLVRVAYSLRTSPRAIRPDDLGRGENLRSDVRWVVSCSSGVGLGWLLVTVSVASMQGEALPSCFAWCLSLFAGGLALGSVAAWRIVSVPDRHDPERLLQAASLIGAGLGLVRLPGEVLLAMSIANGFFCGTALALGSQVLELCSTREDSPAESAAAVGLIGAAIGAFLTSMLFVPLAGAQATLYIGTTWVLALAALVGVMHFQAARPGSRCVPNRRLSPIAYSLFGLAVCLIAGVHIVRAVERSNVPVSDSIFIEQWVKGRRVVTKTVPLLGSSTSVGYQEVREGSHLKGYIFRSEDLTGTVYGYGGPMSCIMFTEPNGTLIDFRLTRSYETPRYMTRIRDWMGRLKGKALFESTPLAGVNAVSGATYSSRAILTLLRNSGRQFAASVLAKEQTAASRSVHWTERIDWPTIWWCAAIPLAFGAIYHGKRWSRLAVLAYTAAISGWWLNRQFSTDHVMRLLEGENIASGPLGALLLLVGIPVLIALVGDVYCGYLCPFGAMQELLSLIVPPRLKPRLSRPVMVAGRYVKYAMLFVLVVVFFTSADKRLLDLDPLLVFFNRQAWSEKPATSIGLVIGLIVLVSGLFVTRLWCRYLCPTGAFLSLFNLGGWLQRFLPAKKFGRCEFGLTGRDRLDCIYCDRCRH